MHSRGISIQIFVGVPGISRGIFLKLTIPRVGTANFIFYILVVITGLAVPF